MIFLPEIIALVTGKPRYRPEIEWSSYSWTHNIFRVFELVCGRKVGIRCEMLTSHYKDEDGWHTIHSPQSFEGACALFETTIRELVHDFSHVRVYIPVFQTASPFPIPASPYLFAIAFDALTSNTATPTSFSHTTTGSNRILIVYGTNDPAPSAASYNGVSMTAQSSVAVPVAGDAIAQFSLLNPASGANTVTCTGSLGTQAGSYTGVSAVSGVNSDTAGDPTTATYTVGVANSVVVCSAYGRNGPHALIPSTGVANDRYGLNTSGIPSFGDSGSVSSNTSMSWLNTGSPNPADTAQIGIVLEPYSAPAATGGFFLAASRR